MPEEPDAEPKGSSDADRWLVVRGRRWRRTDPALPDEVAAALRSHLGTARAGIAACLHRGDPVAVAAWRHRVGLAKHGLGERGPRWWEEPVASRLARADAALDELDATAGR